MVKATVGKTDHGGKGREEVRVPVTVPEPPHHSKKRELGKTEVSCWFLRGTEM